MTGKHADSEKCQQFVANLKKMRDAFGWSQERLAAQSHCTAVAMIESFARSPLPEHGQAFDAAFGLGDMFAKAAREIQGEAYPPAFRSFAEEERKATDLCIFEHSLVPGIFQTERYAQAILRTHPSTSEETIRERVAGRLARQEILTREDPRPPYGRVTEEKAAEAKVRLRFRTLQAQALNACASQALIARMAEDLWTGSAPAGVRALTVAPTVDSV
jgi:hypothetical protein